MRGYCKKSCGECSGGGPSTPVEPCDDRPPLGQHSCEEYKKVRLFTQLRCRPSLKETRGAVGNHT